jgi:hypothetical protein
MKERYEGGKTYPGIPYWSVDEGEVGFVFLARGRVDWVTILGSVFYELFGWNWIGV